MLKRFVPKKFLCRFELKIGAFVYGILFVFVMVACIIAATVDMVSMKGYVDANVKRNAFAFCIMIIIYSVLMIAADAWFLWGVKMGKASVVLVWIAMTSLWLIQTTVLTVIMLCLYIADATLLAWIMCLIFGIVAFVICLYGVLVGYGLWLQIKNRHTEEELPPAE